MLRRVVVVREQADNKFSESEGVAPSRSPLPDVRGLSGTPVCSSTPYKPTRAKPAEAPAVPDKDAPTSARPEAASRWQVLADRRCER